MTPNLSGFFSCAVSWLVHGRPLAATPNLDRRHWASADPIRDVFRRAFVTAGLPYYAPHSLRSTLAQLGEQRCQSAEEFKAWRRNLGHSGVLTTFMSYGGVAEARQAEIIRTLGQPKASRAEAADRFAELADAVRHGI